MRKVVAGGVIVAIAIAAIALWHCRPADSTGDVATNESAAPSLASPAAARSDPRTLERASIAGTVTDDTKAAIPRARVCADGTSPDVPDDVLHDPSCTETDAAGHYVIKDVFAASYTVAAMAPTFRPGLYRSDGDHVSLYVAVGAHPTAIDIVLPRGGVLLSGTVADVSGGPIAHARVSARDRSSDVPGVAVETDDSGRFSLWTAPAWLIVNAGADGYADAWEHTAAPGSVAIQLVPEGSFAGTVVNAATNEPVEGAQVSVTGGTHFGFDVSDAQGRFHVHRLVPGRYTATATAPAAYGRSEGSITLGLGQHGSGTIIRMFPAAQLTGHVVIAPNHEPCAGARVTIRDAREHALTSYAGPDGTVRFDAVLPREYRVDVDCRDYIARDTIARIVVADKSLSGLEWTVEPGATIRGRVTDAAGNSVAGAEVYSHLDNPQGHGYSKTAQTTRDGRYALRGLVAGHHQITAQGDDGVIPWGGAVVVEVAALATVEKNLVLQGVGSISGTVADRDGKPVASLLVFAESGDSRIPVWSGPDGTFHMPGLSAGNYRMLAGDLARLDKLPGVSVTVKPPGTTNVRLTIDTKVDSIRGSVVDANGKPVGDAFVEAAPDNAGMISGGWAEKRVLTGTDGAFALTVNGATYTLRAYRQGGGEAVRERVAAGTTTTLELRPSGSIAGVAKDRTGHTVDDFTVRVVAKKAALVRTEELVHTGGRFVIRDLPAGRYSITATAANGHATREVLLGEGEAKADVNLDLDNLVTLTGRVVELGTSKPVPNMQMMVLVRGYYSRDLEHIPTDDAGRFTIPGVPVGAVDIGGWVSEGKQVSWWLDTARTLSGTGTIDVGDLVAVRKRTQGEDPIGVLGIDFEQSPAGTPPEQWVFEVRAIDPAGPAAKTSLRVGDVIATVDGTDVTGSNYNTGHALLQAPPGTAIRLGLQRGETVTVVLAQPP
jgi:protocatechuate 3,4-dioxygenase beta subunit